MDFSQDDKGSLREEASRLLDEHLTPELFERTYGTGTLHDWGLHRAMAERGWLAAAWPREYGGQERDPFELAALHDELARRGAPVDGMGISLMVAQTIRRVGTEEQRRAIIPRVLAGEIIVALGYSEPDAGSDVAAARTRAVRDGDDWIITGQKMYTTLAHEAAYVFLLTRTNTEVPKHRGLTLFLVPLDLPGIELQPIHTLGGERTNVSFYNDVRVPDSARVGEVDGGWEVMRVALTFERSGSAAGQLTRLLERASEAAGHPDAQGRPYLERRALRRRLARLAIDRQVGRLLGDRTTWVAAVGGLPGVEGSMAKLFSSEAYQRACSALLDAFGPPAIVSGGDTLGDLEHEFRHAAVTTIYGGSSEIQRTIVAEQRLGLPRVGR